MKDYYQILEVSQNASQEVIEKTYKVLVKRYHPDVQPYNKIYWAENKIKELNEAYEVLSNPLKRSDYNLKLSLSSVDSYEKYQQDSIEEIKNNKQKVKSKQLSKIFKHSIFSYIHSYFNLFSSFNSAKNEDYSGEKKKNSLAIILTIIIIALIVILFLNVPFLKNLIFPKY